MKDLEETVEVLKNLTFLQTLNLAGNPLAQILNYRYFIIFHIPWLRYLDCHEITALEKVKATQLFGSNQISQQKLSTSIKYSSLTLFDDLKNEADLILKKQDQLKKRNFVNSISKKVLDYPQLPKPSWMDEFANEYRTTIENADRLLLLKSIFPKEKLIDISAVVDILSNLVVRPSPVAVDSFIENWVSKFGAANKNKIRLSELFKELVKLTWEECGNADDLLQKTISLSKENSADALAYSLVLMKSKINHARSASEETQITSVPSKLSSAHDVYETRRIKYSCDGFDELEVLQKSRKNANILNPSKLKLILLASNKLGKRVELVREELITNAPHKLNSRKTHHSGEKEIINPYETQLVKELQIEAVED